MDSITNHPFTLAVIAALPLFGVVAKIFGASFMRIAKWYLFVAVFAVVVVMNSIFFPFIGGKDYFFRFTVELALIFAVLAWAFEARAGEIEGQIKTMFKRPLVIAVSAFVLVFLLACLFAYDAQAAFWSNYERGEGGFQMIHYYLFFLLLVLLLRTEEDWKNIFRFSLVAAGFAILYGIAGNFLVNGFIGPYASYAPKPIPKGWLGKLTEGRFQASLGNPAYVAPYLLFAMFYGAYLWMKSKSSSISSAWIHTGYAALIAIFLFFFALSQTRGAFLGLGVGAFVLILYFIVAGRGKFRKWSALALLLLIVLGGIAFVFKDSAFVQSWPGARLLEISFSDTTAQTRFFAWGSAWKGFLEKPILGWGPENFTAVFDKYFNPRHFIPGQQTETWFDRAHSVYFDYLSETGVLGLLSYLAIFGVFAWEFFLRNRKTEGAATGEVVERGLMLALVVAYLVQGVAIFDVLPMYLNLFLFAAFASYYFSVYVNHGRHS